MHVPADTLIEALREKGLRITRARRAICEVIAASHGEHLSATDILSRIQERDPGVNASTVYRTIDLLERLDLVQHMHVGHGPGVLHLADEGHQHLVCTTCGRVVDLAPAEVQPLVEAIAGAHGFAAAHLHFALQGLCADCQTGS